MPRKSNRRGRAVTPPESEPSNVARTSQPAALRASTSQDNSDSGDVSGSDNGAPSDPGTKVVVNNPDAVPVRKGVVAYDILHFFDKSGVRAVCKECR